MATEFDFVLARDEFKKSLSNDISAGNFELVPSFISTYKSSVGSETDKRSSSDQAIRDLVSQNTKVIRTSKDSKKLLTTCIGVISATVSLAKHGYCSASLPFILIGDVLDCLTLDACDPVFCFIEERVATWKSPQFYTAGKNYLLRMCNDLLRRLSQAQNNVFCGRIQLFLARLFPLSEKSALNLVSQFNLDNVTVYNEGEENDKIPKKRVSASQGGDELWLDGTPEEMDVDLPEKSQKSAVTGYVDTELYKTIWSVQDFFRNPVQCYHSENWKQMTSKMSEIFRVFTSYKLDDGGRSDVKTTNKAYFAKYLTSKKLIDLQLNDSMFRRQLLIQILILCQYLKGTVKFKSAAMVLSSVQLEWVNSTIETVYKLLDETPPNGKEFSRYIKKILSREDYWIEWKNEGCPSFIKTKPKQTEALASPPAKKKKTQGSSFVEKKSSTIAQDFISGKPLGLGCPELTRLWGLCEDNMAACKANERCFLPSKAQFFAESLEYMDPKNMVEEQYMPYNDINFQWKALRLLSQKSSLFFQSQPSTLQFKSVPQYLKGVIEKLGQEITPAAEEEINMKDEESFEAGSKDEVADAGDDAAQEENEEEEGNESDEIDEEEEDALINDDSQQEDGDSGDDDALLDEPTAAAVVTTLSSDEVTSYAQKLGEKWKTLAPFLDLKPSDINEIQEDSEDVILQARQALVTWQDRNRGQVLNKDVLFEAFKKAGLKVE